MTPLPELTASVTRGGTSTEGLVWHIPDAAADNQPAHTASPVYFRGQRRTPGGIVNAPKRGPVPGMERPG
jgi:hypothetical protein